MPQCATDNGIINPLKEIHNLIGNISFVRDSFTKKKRTHHRHVSKRKNKGTQDRKTYSLRHRLKHLTFNSDQCKYGEVNDQDNDLAKSGCTSNLRCRFINFVIHLSWGQPVEFAQSQVMHRSFNNNYGTVDNQSKINCAKAHKISRHTKYIHQRYSK